MNTLLLIAVITFVIIVLLILLWKCPQSSGDIAELIGDMFDGFND